MRFRANLSIPRPARTGGRVGAALLAAALVLDASSAHADWWRPRGGGSGNSSSGSGSGSGSGSSGYSGSGSGSSSSGGRGSGGSGSSRPTTPPRGGYSPGSCSWVTISRQAQYVDPSGRTVYEITQKNTCTGEVRTLFGY